MPKFDKNQIRAFLNKTHEFDDRMKQKLEEAKKTRSEYDKAKEDAEHKRNTKDYQKALQKEFTLRIKVDKIVGEGIEIFDQKMEFVKKNKEIYDYLNELVAEIQ